MNLLSFVAYIFGGIFAANAVPHFVAGVMGRAFPSPFAKPFGKGLSSPTVNVFWGFGNMVLAYLLLAHVGVFQARAASDIAAFGLGVLVNSLGLARYFGRGHGSDAPSRL